MPGFAEIASGHWSLKGLVASMVLVLVGGVLSVYYQFAETSGATVESGAFIVKCATENCDYMAEYNSKQWGDLIKKTNDDWMRENGIEMPKPGDPGGAMGPMGPMGMGVIMPAWGQPGTEYGLPCPKCGEKSVFRHIKCKQCGEIFMEDYESGGYSDRCPKCNYSASEVRKKERMQEKAAESERKASKGKSSGKKK